MFYSCPAKQRYFLFCLKLRYITWKGYYHYHYWTKLWLLSFYCKTKQTITQSLKRKTVSSPRNSSQLPQKSVSWDFLFNKTYDIYEHFNFLKTDTFGVLVFHLSSSARGYNLWGFRHASYNSRNQHFVYLKWKTLFLKLFFYHFPKQIYFIHMWFWFFSPSPVRVTYLFIYWKIFSLAVRLRVVVIFYSEPF